MAMFLLKPLEGTVPTIRLAGPELLSTSIVTKYTVPAATRTVLRTIHVSNSSLSYIDFTLSIGADSAPTRIYDGIALRPKRPRTFWVEHVLEAGEIIQAYASVSDVITLTIDGEEYEA